MSRPRKPFGADHPGRLQATMIKVLAAEMSDPQRLRRGKQYANDGSVLDILIEPGIVTCEIQGSRPTPYIAHLEVGTGAGMPLRRDIVHSCSCPDDENWGSHACKHVVAAMFAFSDELLLEPSLLAIWRQHDAPTVADRSAAATTPLRRRGHLTLVHSTPAGGTSRAAAGRDESADAANATDGTPRDAHRRKRVAADPLADLLRRPTGSPIPQVPHLDPLEPARAQRGDVGRLVDDALRHVKIEWD